MDSRRDRGDAAGARAGFLERAGFWAIVLLVAALPGIGCSKTGSEIAREPLVGGPCEYRSYPGQAEIVSTTPSGMKRNLTSNRPLAAVEGVTEKSALERTFPLLPDREMPPDRAYVEQLDIRPGTRVGCTLRVITRGTCTPVLFDFPPPAPR